MEIIKCRVVECLGEYEYVPIAIIIESQNDVVIARVTEDIIEGRVSRTVAMCAIDVLNNVDSEKVKTTDDIVRSIESNKIRVLPSFDMPVKNTGEYERAMRYLVAEILIDEDTIPTQSSIN